MDIHWARIDSASREYAACFSEKWHILHEAHPLEWIDGAQMYTFRVSNTAYVLKIGAELTSLTGSRMKVSAERKGAFSIWGFFKSEKEASPSNALQVSDACDELISRVETFMYSKEKLYHSLIAERLSEDVCSMSLSPHTTHDAGGLA